MAAVAALAAIAATLAFPAPAFAAGGPLDPPPPQQLIATADLPRCLDLGMSKGSGHWLPDGTAPDVFAAAARLGWRATTTGAFVNGAYASALVPMIPCSEDLGSDIAFRVLLLQTSLAVSTGSLLDVAEASASLECYDSSLNPQVVDPTSGIDIRGTRDAPIGSVQGLHSVVSAVSDDCEYLRSISVVVQTATSPRQTRVSAIWHPDFWLTDDGHYEIPTSVDDIPDPFGTLELPVNCPFSPSGSDMVALIGSFFATLVDTAVCLFTPSGWDRAGKIASAWEGSALGGLTSAMNAVMPSGLSCGVVASFPVFDDTVELDTCQADIAPGWVKVGVSWALVLACCVACVRRVLWSVGSK